MADGNLISGNARDGISLTGGFQNFGNSKILGNRVGTNAAGTSSLPNGGNGISTSAPQLGVVIGGPNQDANTIAFNLGAGVRSSSRLDTDRFNRLFSNGGHCRDRPCDPSGNGEGQTYLGASTVTLPSNSSGVAEQSFSGVLPIHVAPGSAGTATSTTRVTTIGATVTIGVSSEFSAGVTAT